MLTSTRALAVSLAGVLLLSVSLRAETLSSADGKYTVGITPFGNLYDPQADIGFQRNEDGFDPIAPYTGGMSREAWSVYAERPTGSAYGYVDRTVSGNTTPTAAVGLHVLDGTLTPDGKLSTYLRDGTTNYLQVDQAFSFVQSNVLRIDVTITNPFSVGVDQDVYYKRLVDWDLYGTGGSQDRIDVGEQPDPLVVTSYTFLGDLTVNMGDPGAFTPPVPPVAFIGTWGSRGAGFQLHVGTIKPGYRAEFSVFHVLSLIDGNVNGVLQHLRDAGATALQITGEARPGDTNHSAGLGVSEVSIVPLPSAAWAGMALMGLVAVGHWYRRRAA